ncbi:MAG: GAF domain-containing protein [Gemmatimonadales bacterium]
MAEPTVADLSARVAQLERERTHLLALVDLLQDIAGSLQFTDIVQAITRKLGETFGLDRCSIFLAERGGTTARLVASYEDPGIRNFVVDLARYPELKQALQSGETVFIADAQADPGLKHIRGALADRKVRSITVVPITWRRVVIGAIMLRTFRDAQPFSEEDLRFTQALGALTAKVLRSAWRYEKLQALGSGGATQDDHRAQQERTAFVAFLDRLTRTMAARHGGVDERLGRATADELDRLVDIATTVLAEEGRRR